MKKVNIIVVGAKDSESNDNNVLQASHEDLLLLKTLHSEITITCYDMLYTSSCVRDSIIYEQKSFCFNENFIESHSHNIIIEFCNLLDENDINHMTYKTSDTFQTLSECTIAYLACGCAWSSGFPIDCILHIIENSLHSPTQINNIDSFLYIISTVHCIYNNNIQHNMQPYLRGFHHIAGTLAWRGCAQNDYASENVIRNLLELIIADIDNLDDDDRRDLHFFLTKEKHWNFLKWQTREKIAKFIYGKDI